MNVKLNISGQKAVLSMGCRFDFGSHREFRRCAESALADPTALSVEVDLSAVEYVDSSAIGMLLLLQERAQKAGKSPVRLVGSRESVRRVLEVAHLDRVFVLDGQGRP